MRCPSVTSGYSKSLVNRNFGQGWDYGLGLKTGLGFRIRVSVSDVTWSYISHLITDISWNVQL